LEKYAILQKPTIKQNCKLIEKKVYWNILLAVKTPTPKIKDVRKYAVQTTYTVCTVIQYSNLSSIKDHNTVTENGRSYRNYLPLHHA
jgi:hypothetical protein